MAAGFIQQDGKVYVGTTCVAATSLVTSARLLANLNGNVTIETTWEKAMARWRTRAITDIHAYAIDASISIEELEFRASNVAVLFTGYATGSTPLYGTTATATFWRIKTSTAPKNLQWCFEFVRTDTGKKMQIYAPKVQVENFPTPFSVDNFTMQNMTFQLMASTNGKLIEYLIKK